MNIFNRKKYFSKVKNFLLDWEKLILLYWARQVWKTSLLNFLIDDKKIKLKKYYFNFEDFFSVDFKTKDDFVSYFSFKYKVDFFKEWVLMLDEVQIESNIEQILKSLYDDKNIKLQIIATWSWLWQLNNFWSSLVWRKKEVFVYPFDFFEFLELKWFNVKFLNEKYFSENIFKEIEKYLIEFYRFWWYPAVILEKTEDKKIEKIWEIINTYIERDVNFWLKWNEFADFKKLLNYLVTNIWDLLKLDKISKELWIKVLNIQKYLKILESSFILFSVNPFWKNQRKEYSKQSELFLNDLWIINFFKNNFNFSEFDWKVVENFVFLEILKNKKSNFDEIKFYKKLNWSEIDFIYCQKKWWIIPIEVKIWNKDLIPKVFNWFNSDYWEDILEFKKTTLSEFYQRDFSDKKINFEPFWKIFKD